MTAKKLTQAAKRDLLILADGGTPSLCEGPWHQLYTKGLIEGPRFGPHTLTEEGRRLAAYIADQRRNEDGNRVSL